jgi:hypothetical protein
VKPAVHRQGVLLIALATCLAAAESRLDLEPGRPDLGSLLAIVSTLGAGQHQAAPAVLDRWSEEPPLLLLRGADHRAMQQAIAHGGRTWWAWISGNDVRYADQRTLPPFGPTQPQIYPTPLEEDLSLEDLARQILEPWLGSPASGIAYHAPANRWLINLDSSGHAAAKALFTCLEQPRLPLPNPPPIADIPTGQNLHHPIRAIDGQTLFIRLHEACNISIAVHGSVIDSGFLETVAFPACPLKQLPLQLQALGLQAAFFDGVLCIDMLPVRRRAHPANALQLARIPVAQFGDHLSCETLALQLQSKVQPERWQDPGHCLVYLARHRSLLVSCAPDLLLAIYAALDEREFQP